MISTQFRLALGVSVVLLGAPLRTAAQAPVTAASNGQSPSPAAVSSGLDPSHDSEGRAMFRAVRLTTPLLIDGRLDDEIYKTVPPLPEYVQQDPAEGQPATEHTETWIFFD